MELKDVLKQIESSSQKPREKTASAPAEKSSAARNVLVGALQDALKPASAVKTAAAAPASATQELVKIAGDLATSDAEALRKEAALYGAAVADGFMSRLRQYEQATEGQKTAGVNAPAAPAAPASFEKFAAENPELVKQAAELGYHHGKMQIDMAKQAAFEQGYNDASVQINALSKTAAGQAQLQKIASEIQQQSSLESELQKLGETAEGQEKLAAIKQGYADTMNELTKLAGETFDRGYTDTLKLLQAM